MSEFNLIQHYFTRPTNHTDLGVGDDAALIQVQAGHQLAISAGCASRRYALFRKLPSFRYWLEVARSQHFRHGGNGGHPQVDNACDCHPS